jgi:hypothetical protein
MAGERSNTTPGILIRGSDGSLFYISETDLQAYRLEGDDDNHNTAEIKSALAKVRPQKSNVLSAYGDFKVKPFRGVPCTRCDIRKIKQVLGIKDAASKTKKAK